MPRGAVRCRIEERLKEKEMVEEDVAGHKRGQLKKIKLSTHFTAGLILWNLSRARVTSTTFP